MCSFLLFSFLQNSCGDVERVFVKNMGLSWDKAAALMGVHTLGRGRMENSGYDGWWSDAQSFAVEISFREI